MHVQDRQDRESPNAGLNAPGCTLGLLADRPKCFLGSGSRRERNKRRLQYAAVTVSRPLWEESSMCFFRVGLGVPVRSEACCHAPRPKGTLVHVPKGCNSLLWMSGTLGFHVFIGILGFHFGVSS